MLEVTYYLGRAPSGIDASYLKNQSVFLKLERPIKIFQVSHADLDYFFIAGFFACVSFGNHMCRFFSESLSIL